MDICELLALKGVRIILIRLNEKTGLKYSALVDAVGHSTTTTRALAHLEKLGFVNREVLQDRYRPVMYSLTPRGERLAKILKTLIELDKEVSK